VPKSVPQTKTTSTRSPTRAAIRSRLARAVSVPYAARALQERRRNEGDVPEGQPAEGGHDGPARGPGFFRPGLEIVEVRVGDRPELLHVVGRVELVLLDRRLADDGVEEVSVLGQPARRRCGAIALGEDQGVALGIPDRLEMGRHQDFGTVVQSPGRPAFVAVAEHRLLDQSEHLIWLVDFDRTALQAVALAQRDDDLGVDAGDGRSSEIDGNAVGLLVGQGGENSLLAGHVRLSSNHSPRRTPDFPVGGRALLSLTPSIPQSRPSLFRTRLLVSVPVCNRARAGTIIPGS
jgi:hypothetical protein